MSETLDLLVTAARGDRSAGDARSVVGTISIAPHDPDVSGADAVVRSLFGASNDDPFEALVCAAAHALGLPLVARDRDIVAWPSVRTVW